MIALPIDPHLERISEAVFNTDPVLLTASPGSGKTTRVPARLLRKILSEKSSAKVYVIVPKRLAAVAAADRIATENTWSLGREVGYQVRFDSMLTEQTQLIFMTEGVFIKKMPSPQFLKTGDIVILDEFHERSSNLDLILGYCFEKKLLEDSLRLVVMSATLNTNALQDYFQKSTVIEVEHAPFPLEIVYQKQPQKLVCDQSFFENIKTTALEAWKRSQRDVLIFLPGLKEILKTQSLLRLVFPQIAIEILHGSVQLTEQKRILQKSNSARRFILATNVAESSLTVPDLDCVIDSGLEKNVITEKKLGFSRLQIGRISQFSATQRAGRAARTSAGICFRLWHETDNRSMKESILPEVLESSLLPEVLTVNELGVKDPTQFSWLTCPPKTKILSALEQLKAWRLVDSAGATTEIGHLVNRLPLNVDQAVLHVQLCQLGHVDISSEFFARLETSDLAAGMPDKNNDQRNDIERLLQDRPLTAQQSKIKSQLLALSPKEKVSHRTSINEAFLKIFVQYFPQKIIVRKSKLVGLSASGRGVELAVNSSAAQFDYWLALSGYDKSDSVTVIGLALGYEKNEALAELGKHLQNEAHIEFDSERQTFYKTETKKFGAFVFSQSGKVELSKKEIEKSWQTFFKDDPKVFLNLNSHYADILSKLQFLSLKSDVLGLSAIEISVDAQFEQKLVTKITTIITDFEDFKNIELIHYLEDVVAPEVLDLLRGLPDSMSLPSGKSVRVNYTDAKAPMISARLQDCFGWSETPRILNNQLKVTIELLAPNMRPTQITQDLNYFWQNSYQDVRKELRARYPKHAWPENPVNADPIIRKPRV